MSFFPASSNEGKNYLIQAYPVFLKQAPAEKVFFPLYHSPKRQAPRALKSSGGFYRK